MYKEVIATYEDGYGMRATLEKWSNGLWFVSMTGRSKEYKTRRGAERYIKKMGYSMKEA